MHPFSKLLFFWFLALAFSLARGEDMYCEAYREELDLIKPGPEDTALLAQAEKYALADSCEPALDLLMKIQTHAQAAPDSLPPEMLRELKDLEAALDRAVAVQETEVEPAGPDTDAGPGHVNTFSLKTDYYSSDPETYAYTNDALLQDTSGYVPGSRSLAWGLEHRYSRTHSESIMPFMENRLSLLNEYLYDRLENRWEQNLLNKRVSTDMNSILSFKRHHLDDSTSFLDMVLRPGIEYRGSASWKTGLEYSGEFKRYKIQKSGYEDFNKSQLSGSFSFLGEHSDIDAYISGIVKQFPDSTLRNYTLNTVSLTPRYYFGNAFNTELNLTRENLVYVNYPAGRDRELTWTAELTPDLAITPAVDITVPAAWEKTRYTQYDSVEDLRTYRTNYTALRLKANPVISWAVTENFSAESGIQYERLRVNIQDNWEDSLHQGYFIPKEDDYNNYGASMYVSWRCGGAESALGTEFDVYRYIGSAVYDNADYKSLRLSADISWPFRDKWTFTLNADWPFPGMEAQNSVLDKSLAMELEYRL